MSRSFVTQFLWAAVTIIVSVSLSLLLGRLDREWQARPKPVATVIAPRAEPMPLGQPSPPSPAAMPPAAPSSLMFPATTTAQDSAEDANALARFAERLSMDKMVPAADLDRRMPHPHRVYAQFGIELEEGFASSEPLQRRGEA